MSENDRTSNTQYVWEIWIHGYDKSNEKLFESHVVKIYCRTYERKLSFQLDPIINQNLPGFLDENLYE